MKLLLDANISWRVAKIVSPYFAECIHINTIFSTTSVTDISIWNYALDESYLIVTNDEDFLNLLLVKGFPPKIILLRTGNQNNLQLAQLIIKHKTDIEQLFYSDELGILELR